MNIDYSEHLQLAKRHSFPYMKVYTWNTLGGSQSQVKEIPLNNAADSVPAIKSDGTSQERQARLEEAMVWIRKELSDMRHQDKFLTRQFIQLRATIQRIKRENSLLDGGMDDTQQQKEPSFRHSVPGPSLRPTLGRSISYM
ncbi:unnamed protein product [Porites evermanni]|uniref:Uncharacterized protein n=1 Tax=Porites evermanni TaxID=104178 RepID=A0ABN8LUI1_9CNID|nr:unnamed protein product [Porites evermanni]